MNGRSFAFLITQLSIYTFLTATPLCGQFANTLLDAGSVHLSKKQDAQFLFHLTYNDEIRVNVNDVEGGEHSDVKIRIVRLETEITMAEFDGGADDQRRTVKIRDDGTYRITYTSDRSVNIATVVRKTPRKALEKGQWHTVLQCRSCWVGDVNEPGQPRFTFSLAKDDKLFVASASSSADILKYEVVQTGELVWVTGAEPTEVSSAGDITIQLHIEGESERILLFDKTQKGADFDDLQIRHYVHDPDAANEAAGDPGIEAPAGPDPLVEILKAQQDMMEESTEAGRQTNETIMEKLDEMISEMNKRDTVLISAGKVEFTEIRNVPPRYDLSQNRRHCRPFEDLQYIDPQYWAFWVGVGEEAQQAFLRQQSIAHDHSLLEVYATSSASDRIPFPRQLQTEQIEIAIVDKDNKDLFERGRPYREYTMSRETSGSMTDSKYGLYQFRAEDDVFLCYCNHNTMSPVNLWLIYEGFTYEER